MDIQSFVSEKAGEAREGARAIAQLSTDKKNSTLIRMAEALKRKSRDLQKANAEDINLGKRKGLSKAMIDRLTMTEKRIYDMAQGLVEIANLPDPVGEITRMWRRPNGMTVGRMRVPIGVIGIIYESRPNVTADATALCLKAGNAVVLRGGSEALHSNMEIVRILKSVAKSQGIHEGVITFISIPDREAVMEMLKLEGIIDLIIPRGGEGLIRAVTANSRIPVLKHYKGVCHVFVDRDADIRMAENICLNAKVQRPGTCNAMETLLVDEGIAAKFLPRMVKKLHKSGVQLKGCRRSRNIVPALAPVKDEDFFTEYLDKVLNIRIVRDIEAAIRHITKYGSAHTDAIVTEDYEKAMSFLREVDSSSVCVNVSTRFSDGYEYGLGAEMGISTDKIHARGPMGIEELTCLKFIVLGNGQIRE